MENSQTDKKTLDSIREEVEKLNSIIILLETDLEMQHTDSVYANIIKVIHGLVKSVRDKLEKI